MCAIILCKYKGTPIIITFLGSTLFPYRGKGLLEEREVDAAVLP